jgi:transporter family protein
MVLAAFGRSRSTNFWILRSRSSAARQTMALAGFTSVVAKLGLTGISGDLGLAVRDVLRLRVRADVRRGGGPRHRSAPPHAEQPAPARLGLSGVTTACSWVFHCKAIKLGEVSTVALIDKGSIVAALLLARAILGEGMTAAKLPGGGLIVAGLLVIARG